MKTDDMSIGGGGANIIKNKWSLLNSVNTKIEDILLTNYIIRESFANRHEIWSGIW